MATINYMRRHLMNCSSAGLSIDDVKQMSDSSVDAVYELHNMIRHEVIK